jgi:hypothetical protein
MCRRLLLAASLFAAGCSPQDTVTGRYTHASDPAEWIELRGDGGFVAQTAAGSSRGTWERHSEDVHFSAPAAGLSQARLSGRFLVAPGGDRWVRRWPSGHYVHERHSGYFLDLKPDGSYHYARGPNDHRGRYESEGGQLTLWYPADGSCTRSDGGPAVPSPGLCAFRALVHGDRLTFYRLKGPPEQQVREDGEELLLETRPD